HQRRNHNKSRDHDLARRTVVGAKPEQRGKRDTQIKRIPLVEAERARRIAEHVLEKQKSTDCQRADNRHDCRRGKWRVTLKQSHITVHLKGGPCRWTWVVPVVGVEPTLLLGTRF